MSEKSKFEVEWKEFFEENRSVNDVLEHFKDWQQVKKIVIPDYIAEFIEKNSAYALMTKPWLDYPEQLIEWLRIEGFNQESNIPSHVRENGIEILVYLKFNGYEVEGSENQYRVYFTTQEKGADDESKNGLFKKPSAKEIKMVLDDFFKDSRLNFVMEIEKCIKQ